MFFTISHALFSLYVDYYDMLYMGQFLQIIWKLQLVQNVAAQNRKYAKAAWLLVNTSSGLVICMGQRLKYFNPYLDTSFSIIRFHHYSKAKNSTEKEKIKIRKELGGKKMQILLWIRQVFLLEDKSCFLTNIISVALRNNLWESSVVS